MAEIKTLTRRSFLNKGGKLILGLLGAGIMTGGYDLLRERFWYQIREVNLAVRNLPKAFVGWRIVQFSDVHLGFHYGVKELRSVIKMINNVRPDVIFFTGDFVESFYGGAEEAIPLLQDLQAPRGGKWAVLGNHDYMTLPQVVRTYQNSQFRLLRNECSFIESEGDRLYVAGLKDAMNDSPNLKEALQGLSGKECVLLLVHEPDLADYVSTYGIGAQFSGHSHGGQVRLPFLGPVITQKYAEKYVDGLYYAGENRMPLYVNRGIGTTHLPIRLFCRPEITVFHLS